MTLILTLLLLLSCTSSTPVHASNPTPPHPLSHHPIKLRLPPALNPTVDSSPPTWQPMPSGWYYGDWFVAHSSNKAYQALRDLVWSISPVLPTCGLLANSTPAACAPGTFPGQLNDLSTWLAANSSSSVPYISAFAYDTPRRVNNASAGRGWVDVWDTVGTGTLSYFQNGW
ncbi:hypothetical protein LTR08_001336 [Meristemomyces frigidus]|nr:hypothetical protein LTR08_001336 [Meristemomyces frigidus]